MATEQPKEADPPKDTPPASSSDSQPVEQQQAAAAAPPPPSEPIPTQKPTGQEQPPPAPAPAADAAEEEAPDPDEDDLSDLDDVLDEFAATNISKPNAPTSSGPGRPVPEPAAAGAAPPGGVAPSLGGAGPGGLFADEDEFAKSLQAGMAELLGEFESNPDMQKQFEDLVKELGDGMGGLQGELGVPQGVPLTASAEGATAASTGIPAATEAGASASKASATAQPSFEDTIRATMERMSASSAAASSAASKSAANPEDDFLAAMLKEMEREGGMGNDEDFSKMLLGMMEQLTNKEILYEPMKELNDKFPAWMRDNKDKTPKEDLDRYTEQQRLVGEIVAKFEDKGYSDGKAEYREYIVERMQQMQAAGSPPPDLVGDMNAAQEALGDLDAGCPQQ